MKIAIMGRTQMLYATARLLLAAGHTIALVATCKESPEYTVRASDFEDLARGCGAAFVRGPDLSDKIDVIRAAGAEVAVSMNWPGILGEDIIDLFPHGILNAHPGDLPHYRGNACPNWAILNGEEKITLTIHQMAPQLDAGAIVLKEHYTLLPKSTIGEVYHWLEESMPPLYLRAAEGLVNGSITPQPQSTELGDISRAYPRLPVDGFIDWALPAADIVRLVRASSEPFAGAYTYCKGEKLVVLRATAGQYAVESYATPGQVVAIDRRTGKVSVAAGQGFVTLGRVLYNGKVYERPDKVLPSLRGRLGMAVADEVAALQKRVAALEQKLARLTDEKGGWF